MLRILTLLLTGSLATLAFMTYGTEHDTRAQQQRLAELDKAIVAERDSIAILRAEWSHLNRPQRLERLARKHLGLKTLEARQIVSIGKLDIPARGASTPEGVVSDGPEPLEALRQPAVVRR